MTLILKTTEWKSCCVQRSPARSLVRSDAAEQTRNHGAQQDPLERLTERTGTVPVSDHFVSHFQRQRADLSSPAGGHRVAVSVRNLTGEVEERGESWSEPQLPKNARRGGVKSARRRDESTLDGHDLNDFVLARLNISRRGIFWRGKCRWRALRKETNKHTDCLHVSCRYFTSRGLLAELRYSKEGGTGPNWEPVTEQLRTMVKFHNSDLWIAWMVIFCMEGKLCETLETCAPVLQLRAELTLRTDSPMIIILTIIMMITFTGWREHISKGLQPYHHVREYNAPALQKTDVSGIKLCHGLNLSSPRARATAIWSPPHPLRSPP